MVKTEQDIGMGPGVDSFHGMQILPFEAKLSKQRNASCMRHHRRWLMAVTCPNLASQPWPTLGRFHFTLCFLGDFSITNRLHLIMPDGSPSSLFKCPANQPKSRNHSSHLKALAGGGGLKNAVLKPPIREWRRDCAASSPTR